MNLSFFQKSVKKCRSRSEKRKRKNRIVWSMTLLRGFPKHVSCSSFSLVADSFLWSCPAKLMYLRMRCLTMPFEPLEVVAKPLLYCDIV